MVNGQQSLGEEEEFEPRMDAKEREGKSYWLFVIGYWGRKKQKVESRKLK